MSIGRHNPDSYGPRDADAFDPSADYGRIQPDPMAGLNRITALAAYRILSGAQLPDALTLSAVDRIPVEPPDGSVLKFEKSWGRARTYTYTALRVGDRWYRSGRHSDPITWEELKDYIHNNRCWICTTWAEVPVVEPSPFEDMTPAEWHAAMFPQAATVEADSDQS